MKSKGYSMAKSITEIKPTPAKKRNLMSTIAEMIGKIAPVNNWLLKTSMTWDLYSASPSVDYSKVNYTLTRAIFYASKVTDNVTRKSYGAEYLFGASFGKPIVNSSAAFAFAKMPEISIDKNKKMAEEIVGTTEEQNSGDLIYTQEYIDEWLDNNEADVFKLCRNSLRDGDQYILIKDNATGSLIPPEQVEIIDDPITGEILGFDVKVYVTETGPNKGEVKVKYITKYRVESPYRELWKYNTSSDKSGTLLEADEAGEDDVETIVNDEGMDETVSLKLPLPIIGFHNEKDARERYGNSEYQNCYYLMANYHAVLESAIRNNIYNSSAVPIVKGVTDVRKWLEANGYADPNDSGKVKIKWKNDKLMVGGKDFDMKFVEGAKNAKEAETILAILFWLICQTSETPEFIMGTAVKSSNASVNSQMPVVLRKANRKRTEYRPYFKNLIKLVLYKASLTDTRILADASFDVSFPEILDDDLSVNVDIVKTLSEEGCITDRTKLMLLNMGRYVSDFKKEIKDAHDELEQKRKEMDYGQNSDQSTQTEKEEK